jgi:hypothetical protein
LSTTPDTSELRNLLAVVLEALDIPAPATVGDETAHDRTLSERVTHAKIALRNALEENGGPLGIEWTTAYLRERLTEHPPTGYRAWGAA